MRPAEFPDKRASRRAFDRAAASYDDHAILHREVGARLLQHLEPMRVEPRRVLDLGCGTGAQLEALRHRFPSAMVVGADLSPAMLRAARRRAPWWRRTLRSGPALVCADAEGLPLAASSCDAVISNLALQWCRPEPVFSECARVLSKGGLLLFSTLGPDTLKEFRAAFGGDAAAHVHAFVDMHDLGDALVHAGFADPVMEMEMLTLEYGTVEAIVRDLRATGTTNALAKRPRGLHGSGWWKRMVSHYETLRRDGALPASYEVIYGHAWRTERRASADGRQVIEFRPRTG